MKKWKKGDKLTPHYVRTLGPKPNGKPKIYVDAGRTGLMLVVRSETSKSWVQQIFINGKRKRIGLGSTRFIGLAEARDKAFKNQHLARTGKWQEAEGQTLTFAAALQKTIAQERMRKQWKPHSKTESSWNSTMETYAFPIIGNMPVHKITKTELKAILDPLWIAKPEIATKLFNRLKAVMTWCVDEDHRNDNPMSKVKKKTVKGNGNHFPTLGYKKTGEVLNKVESNKGYDLAKLALRFTVLTGARSGETCGAVWSEIDLKGKTWTIPDERMKAGKEHRVPLSKQAIEILNTVKPRSINDLVFPSARGKQMKDNAMSRLLRENGYKGKQSVHGFRSSFSDWASEKTNTPREIIQRCLSHIEGKVVEKAYRRTDFFEKRRPLMQDWADYINQN